MAGTRKLVAPVTLFAAIEQGQHAALRALAFEQHRSLADVTRDALTEYIRRHQAMRPAAARRSVSAKRGVRAERLQGWNGRAAASAARANGAVALACFDPHR